MHIASAGDPTPRLARFVVVNCCVQFWYWGPMSEANKTIAASPVFKLPNIYPFIHKEYSWPDFVAQVMTNLQDDKVRAAG
jgi:hypothetical protein